MPTDVVAPAGGSGAEPVANPERPCCRLDVPVPADKLSAVDRLGTVSVARNLKAVVDSYPTPFCFGIYGPWGSGKTTLAGALARELALDQSNRVVWFNTWMYERLADRPYDEVALALLSAIRRTLDPDGVERKLFRSLEKVLLATGLCLADHGLHKLSLGGLSVEKVKANLAYADDALADRVGGWADEAAEFQGLLKGYVRQLVPKGGKLVVFLDDADRCMSASVVGLLQRLKNFFLVPGTVFILAVDRRSVEDSIERVYQYSTEFARTFLDRIVFLGYSVHRRNYHALTLDLVKQDRLPEYVARFAMESIHPELLSEPLAEVLGIAFPLNVRAVVRLYSKLAVALRTLEFANVFQRVTAEPYSYLNQARVERSAVLLHVFNALVAIMALKELLPQCCASFNAEFLRQVRAVSPRLLRLQPAEADSTRAADTMKQFLVPDLETLDKARQLVGAQPMNIDRLVSDLYTALAEWL